MVGLEEAAGVAVHGLSQAGSLALAEGFPDLGHALRPLQSLQEVLSLECSRGSQEGGHLPGSFVPHPPPPTRHALSHTHQSLAPHSPITQLLSQRGRLLGIRQGVPLSLHRRM